MVRLNLSLDEVGSFQETTAFLKKRSSILRIYKDFHEKNPKFWTSLELVKLLKALENHPKLKLIISFK